MEVQVKKQIPKVTKVPQDVREEIAYWDEYNKGEKENKFTFFMIVISCAVMASLTFSWFALRFFY